jgi:hypothetical protein
VDIKEGKISIDIEDLVSRDEFLTEFAKHACFNRYLFNGITQLLLTDEAEWPDEENGVPWWISVSFGRSYFEEARALLIAKADEAARKQVELFKKERDTFEKYYRDYQSKFWDAESTINSLRHELRCARQLLAEQSQAHLTTPAGVPEAQLIKE